jgi:hypothetical protein
MKDVLRTTWRFESHDDHYLINNAANDQCLESDMETAVLSSCNSQNDKQLWQVKHEDGFGRHEEVIISKYANNKNSANRGCLTIKISRKTGSNVLMIPCRNSVNRVFVRGYQSTTN